MTLSRATLQDQIDSGLEQVEELINKSLTGSRDLLNTVATHLSSAGGKRMRPALVLLCAHLGERGITEQVLKSAVVVELTHLATLYHDDVMDSAPTRRGAPAAHQVWGNNAAILAGDMIFARASKLCAGLGEEAVYQHADTFNRLCEGQLNETFGPGETDDPVDFYIKVLSDKTGSLVAQAARFGAMFGGASDEIAEKVYRFGDLVGVAFQLADDVIDLASDGEISGKTPGTDLREGVETMPTLLLRKAGAEGRLDANSQEILDLLNHGDMRDDAQVERVICALRNHEVLENTRQMAFQWCESACEAISDLPDGMVKESLFEFSETLVRRIS